MPEEDLPKSKLWIFGINDAKTHYDLSATYTKSGNFSEDFKACCEANDILPHPALSKPGSDDDTAIFVQGILIDRVSMKITK